MAFPILILYIICQDGMKFVILQNIIWKVVQEGKGFQKRCLIICI